MCRLRLASIKALGLDVTEDSVCTALQLGTNPWEDMPNENESGLNWFSRLSDGWSMSWGSRPKRLLLYGREDAPRRRVCACVKAFFFLLFFFFERGI